MKKIWLSLCIFLVLSTCLMASSVSIWSPLSVETNSVIQQLTDEKFTPITGISVKIESIPSADSDSKYLLAAASGDTPDIGITGSLGPVDLGIRGAAVDLRERFGEEYLEIKRTIYPGLMRSFDFKDTDFGLPIDIALYPLGYRKDILTEMAIDLPETWSELYKILPKLQANNMNFAPAYGFSDNGNIAYADVSMFIWQHGADWYSEDRQRSGLDSPEAIRAFTEYTELYTKHNVPKAVDSFMEFKNGDLPLLQLTNWWYSSFLMATPELKGKWGVTVVPGTPREDGTINHAAYIGGMTFVQFKNSKKIDEAFQWIKWWLSTENQIEYANLLPQRIPGNITIPPNIHALSHMPLPQEDLAALMKQAEHSIAPAYALAPESVTHRYINNACAKVVLHDGDPLEAILEASREMNKELERKQKEYARFISRL